MSYLPEKDKKGLGGQKLTVLQLLEKVLQLRETGFMGKSETVSQLLKKVLQLSEKGVTAMQNDIYGKK